MKFIVSLVLLAITAPVIYAQQVIYDENAEVRHVARFNAIEVSGTILLYLSQGGSNAVAISAGDEKYNSKIKTEVKNGVLVISVDGGVWNSFSLANRKLKAYVSVSDLNRLEVSGASYVNISGTLRSGNLQLNIAGASEVKGNIQADQLNMNISGASVAKLSGNAKAGLIEAGGACKVTSYDLSIDKLKATASGASSISISVNNELNADASGGATIRYKGNAMTGTINASAGASIRKMSGE